MKYHDWHKLYLDDDFMVALVRLEADSSDVIWTISRSHAESIRETLSEGDQGPDYVEQEDNRQLVLMMNRNLDVDEWLGMTQEAVDAYFEKVLPRQVLHWMRAKYEEYLPLPSVDDDGDGPRFEAKEYH